MKTTVHASTDDIPEWDRAVETSGSAYLSSSWCRLMGSDTFIRVADGDKTVGGFVYAALTDTDLDTWARMHAMNATSAFLCSREAVPSMRARRWGRIINVAAMPAVERGAANMSAYAAAKASVLSLTHSLAKELGGDGITVNAVAPTIIDTAANRAAKRLGCFVGSIHLAVAAVADAAGASATATVSLVVLGTLALFVGASGICVPSLLYTVVFGAERGTRARLFA